MEGSVSIVQHLLDPVHGEPAGGGRGLVWHAQQVCEETGGQ